MTHKADAAAVPATAQVDDAQLSYLSAEPDIAVIKCLYIHASYDDQAWLWQLYFECGVYR